MSLEKLWLARATRRAGALFTVELVKGTRAVDILGRPRGFNLGEGGGGLRDQGRMI